jgi:hypothetical protein
LVEALPVTLEFAAAHGAFLASAGGALGQHVEFALLRQQLHPQLWTHFLPGFLGQLLFQLG